jgi:two-component system response regulator FixJ
VGAFLLECDALPAGPLLLDIRMPGLSGLELLEQEGGRLVRFAVIIVTGHGDVDAAVRALKSGAVDFIEKPFDANDLLSMLERGYDQLLKDVEHARRERDALAKVQRLSLREMDVLQGLLAGGSHKLIARHLNLSDRTVEMYRQNMVKKLGARGTTEAVHIGVLAKIAPAKLS